MQHLVFFISTGRCGTQWYTATLRKLYADRAVVLHEPMGPLYRPRQFMRAYNRLDEMKSPKLIRHLQRIADVSRSQIYIETGWPCFSAIPLFIQEFGDRVKVVHLTRHPVPTALSLMTHNYYRPKVRRDWYTRHAALDPFCKGVRQKDYRGAWTRLSQYEKCLFLWTEIHLYAEELADRYPSLSISRVSMEELFSGDEAVLRRFTCFLGLPFREALRDAVNVNVDTHQRRTATRFDWRLIFRHQRCVSLANRLGYDLTKYHAAELDDRYRSRKLPPRTAS